MNPDPLGPRDSLTHPEHAGAFAATTVEPDNDLSTPVAPFSARTSTADSDTTRRVAVSELMRLDPPARKRQPRWKRSFALAQMAALAFVAYVALFHVSVVRGSSMAPGIHDGDRIVVDHFAYMLGNVQRGDIVVLKYPLDPSLDYIKRVIGLPGDEVLIDHGNVWVNGKELTEPYVESTDPLSRTYVRVQPAHYFVLGDNRPRSSDSREFGQVPMDYVRGRVEIRLWPISRIGAVR